MAGFSIMLMNFIFLPLLFVVGLVVVGGLFCLGGLTAAGAIFLFGRIAGRQNDRTLYIRTASAAQVTALLRGANARGIQTTRPGYTGTLVTAKISTKTDLEALMRRIAASCAGIQGMYVK